jgi:CRP-like cAMP-binding protein
MGRLRSATDGLRAAARQAIDLRNLPLAVAAIDELRAFGADITQELEEVASAFCQGSARLLPEAVPMPHPELGDFQPLSAFLTGPALASKAAQIVQEYKRAQDQSAGAERPLLAPVPLFSGLPKDALRDLLSAFEVATVPAGKRVIEEGQVGDAAYLVARGELEISRRAFDGDGKPRVVVARLGSGAFFGEMALLSPFPAQATVTATRPSILLAGKRDTLGAVAAKHPEVGAQLAAHCRRHLVANLGWTSSVVAAVPPQERAAMVERLETRFYEKGERLVSYGEETAGLHLIASGEVALVARDAGDQSCWPLWGRARPSATSSSSCAAGRRPMRLRCIQRPRCFCLATSFSRSCRSIRRFCTVSTGSRCAVTTSASSRCKRAPHSWEIKLSTPKRARHVRQEEGRRRSRMALRRSSRLAPARRRLAGDLLHRPSCDRPFRIWRR